MKPFFFFFTRLIYYLSTYVLFRVLNRDELQYKKKYFFVMNEQMNEHAYTRHQDQ